MECIKPTVVRCEDYDALMSFLLKIDNTLPVSLSARVDLGEFLDGNLRTGFIFAVLDGKEVAAAAFVYHNFYHRAAAYLNLLATVPDYYGKGYAKVLMDKIESDAKEKGMTEFHLHTNATNQKAVSLYAGRGYEVTETEPKLHMVKML